MVPLHGTTERMRAGWQFIVVGTVISLLAIFLWRLPARSMLHSVVRLGEQGVDSTSQVARNETLGFERIVALSRGTPWRVHGLHAAAAESGLDIIVPEQPPINEDLVRAFEALGSADVKKPTHGSAMAWFAHLDLLRHIIQSNFQTVLIVEDDVDWSVHIKQQMSMLSEKVREYTKSPDIDSTPYGTGWDVLWLGHCGEWYDPKNPPDLLSWPDVTNGRRADWRGVYGPKWLMDLPEGHRSIFWSRSPICTYAYAVTREGAIKALEWAGVGQEEAYDIKLRTGCQTGGLKCISIVDQLFHHYRLPEEFGQGSEIGDINGHRHTPPVEDFEHVRGSTAVILESARCRAMFGSTCYDNGTDRPFRD